MAVVLDHIQRQTPVSFKSVAGPLTALVAITSSTPTTVYRSTDGGATWSGPTSTSFTGGVTEAQLVAWNGSQYLLTGGDKVAYSADGITFTEVNLPVSTGESDFFNTVSWSGSEWVVGRGKRRNTVSRSVDGINWTNHNLGDLTGTPFHLTWDGARFVAVIVDNITGQASLSFSSNGISWSSVLALGSVVGLEGGLVPINASTYLLFDGFFSPQVIAGGGTSIAPATGMGVAYAAGAIDNIFIVSDTFAARFVTSVDGITFEAAEFVDGSISPFILANGFLRQGLASGVSNALYLQSAVEGGGSGLSIITLAGAAPPPAPVPFWKSFVKSNEILE